MRGTIGFCTKRASFVSKVIRWFTRSRWSHTYVIRQVEPDILVLEASTFQVQLVPVTKYESRKYANVFFRPEGFKDADVSCGLMKAEEKIETHYGWLQLVGNIPVIIAKRLFGLKIRNLSRGGVVCSELVLQYLRGLDPSGPWGSLDKNTVSPEDLYEVLSSHMKFKKVESL